MRRLFRPWGLVREVVLAWRWGHDGELKLAKDWAGSVRKHAFVLLYCVRRQGGEK